MKADGRYCGWCLSDTSTMMSATALRNGLGKDHQGMLQYHKVKYRYPCWRRGPNGEWLCSRCFEKHRRRIRKIGVYAI